MTNIFHPALAIQTTDKRIIIKFKDSDTDIYTISASLLYDAYYYYLEKNNSSKIRQIFWKTTSDDLDYVVLEWIDIDLDNKKRINKDEKNSIRLKLNCEKSPIIKNYARNLFIGLDTNSQPILVSVFNNKSGSKYIYPAREIEEEVSVTINENQTISKKLAVTGIGFANYDIFDKKTEETPMILEFEHEKIYITLKSPEYDDEDIMVHRRIIFWSTEEEYDLWQDTEEYLPYEEFWLRFKTNKDVLERIALINYATEAKKNKTVNIKQKEKINNIWQKRHENNK